MLPGLSGIELCRRLRARPDTKRLPIIMLTARGEESERVRGLATVLTTTSSSRSRAGTSARVRALLRRALPERLADVLSFGDLEVDREEKAPSPRRPLGRDPGLTEYRPARIPDGAARPRVLARTAAQRRVGQPDL